MFKMKRFWIVLLVPMSVVLTMLAHRWPLAAERWFSQGLYRLLAATYGRVFGYLPFSVAQFLVIALPILAIVYIVRRRWTASRLVANAACVVGVVWFMFTMLAGLNYARLEFSELIGLEVQPASMGDLVALGDVLAKRLNELSFEVDRADDEQMQLSKGNFATARRARDAFRTAGEEFPVLGGFVSLPKPIIYSQFFSCLRIVGIYSPFTMEANVNVHVPDYHIPATMLHELAHFKGIMREDEANFIAWLVGKRSGDAEFMYSAYMLAFSHTAGQLRRVSYGDYRRIMDGLADGVHADLRANQEYWQQFTGPLADISTAANDAYLRANRQEDGVDSYGRMVDLLIAHYADQRYPRLLNVRLPSKLEYSPSPV